MEQQLSNIDARVVPMNPALSDQARAELLLKNLRSERRQRSLHFAEEFLSEAPWEILLLLAVAEYRGHRRTISAVCASVEAAPTTALRWIHKLTEAGHLRRREDPCDKRRSYVELSPESLHRMGAYCANQAPRLAVAC